MEMYVNVFCYPCFILIYPYLSRVAELEQENARLLAIAKGGTPSAPAPGKKTDSDDALVSEIEQLRAQLRAAEERERELNAELTAKSASRDVPPVKIEPSEPSFPLSPTPRLQSPHKSAASLGLMVCNFFYKINFFGRSLNAVQAGSSVRPAILTFRASQFVAPNIIFPSPLLPPGVFLGI
jgi:hypothetical protein